MTKLKKRYMLVAAAALVALVGIVLSSGGKTKTDILRQPPLVRTYMLETDNGGHFQLTGEVQARVESDLGFRVPGKIVKRLVDQGQRVTKGQPLMELDVTDLELAREAAHAAVVAAKAENLQALQDEERQRALLEEQVVSNHDYELAKALADATTAKLLEAEANAPGAVAQLAEG